jgi:hypothetical protein
MPVTEICSATCATGFTIGMGTTHHSAEYMLPWEGGIVVKVDYSKLQPVESRDPSTMAQALSLMFKAMGRAAHAYRS